MTYSYTQKNIRVTVLLDGATEQTFDGFDTNVTIEKSGCPGLPKATVSMRGLSLETMAGLTRLAFEPLARRQNHIKIEAGEKDGSLSVVFSGEVATAWADFNSAPSVEFRISATSGSYPSLIPQTPISVVGEQTAADTIEALCKEIGYTFENNGVTASISNCIIEGDPITKMRTVAQMAGFDILIDDETVVILPQGEVREERGTVPLISAESGMIGYPTFSERGISLACFFNPSLRIGSTVQVESVVPRATGKWKITSLRHNLAANGSGGGPWRTEIDCIYIR